MKEGLLVVKNYITCRENTLIFIKKFSNKDFVKIII